MYLSFINNYGILLLVIVFVLLNLYYRNILNILILILLFLFLRNVMLDKTALFVAYIITIIFGITKNFHLLENFNTISKNEIPITEHKIVKNVNKLIDTEISPDEVIKLENIKKMVNKKLKDSISNTDINYNKKKIKQKNKKNSTSGSVNMAAPNVGSIISEELINQFINIAKENDSVNVSKRNINMYELKPTLPKLNKKKIEKISYKFLNNEKCEPVIISNDKFIIDGHHRWYSKKAIVENNTNGYNDNTYSEQIRVVVIDYPIKKLIQKLQEYKIKYNHEYLSKSLINLEEVKNSEQQLKEIKEKLSVIENNYSKLNSIKVK
jgi:hypothetical protein